MPSPGARRVWTFGLPLVLWAALCALFFSPILLGRERLPTGDFLGQVYAFARFQSIEMAQGRLPVWSPGSYGGIPFAADVQSAILYPPRWLTLWATARPGLSYYALQLEGIAHIVLAGAAMVLFMVAVTGRRIPALVSAITFGLSGYLTSYPLFQLPVLETVAWLPLVLLVLRRGVTSTRPGPWLLGAGGLLALSLSAGHPQTWLHVAYASGAYYLFLTIRARWRPGSILGLGALMAVVAAGASAGTWLPSLAYALRTTRAAVDYRYVASGLPLEDWVQALLPGTRVMWSPQYVGITALALALWGWAGRSRLPEAKRAEVVYWASLALVTGWLALGDSGVLFELAYRVLPGLALFRQQERWLGLVSLAMAVLAGLGTAAWLESSREREWHGAPLRTAALSLAGGLLLAVFFLGVAARQPATSWGPIALRQAVLAALAVALLGLSPRPWAGPAMVALLALDLSVMGLTTRTWERQPPSEAVPPVEWVEVVQQEPVARIDSGGLYYANVGELYGVEDIRGISPLRGQALSALETLPRERLWRLLGVGYVIAPRGWEHPTAEAVVDIPGRPAPGPHHEATLYRLHPPAQRVWLAPQVVLMDGPGAALAALHDVAVDLDRQVVLEARVPEPPVVLRAVAVDGVAPAVRVARPRPDLLQIEVTTPTSAVLVVSEWFMPGWRATVDGVGVPIVRANYGLQAVSLPAGRHDVVWRYVPVYLYLGLGIALVTILVALACARTARLRPALGGEWRLPALPLSSVVCRRGWELQTGRLAAGAIVLLALVLRLACIGCAELRGDEAFSYLMSSRALPEIIPALLRQGDPHSPLHYLLLHLWMRLTGDGELALRLPSALAGVALLTVMMALGRRWEVPRVGLVAAGMAAMAQSLVWLSQDARSQYAMALLFGALSVVLLQDALRRGGAVRWGAYAGVSALAIYSHFYSAFAVLAHLFIVAADRARGRRLVAWAVGYGVAGALAMAWVAVLWPGLYGAGQLAAPSQPNMLRYLVRVGTWLTLGDGLHHGLSRWAFILALGLVVVGARYALRERPAAGWMLVGWLGSAVLGIYAVLFRRDTFDTFHIAVAAPAWWLLLAWGFEACWRALRPGVRLLGTVALAALLAANVLSLAGHYRDGLSDSNGWYRCAADYVREAAREGDALIVNAPDPSIHYYLRHQDIPRSMMPRAPGEPYEGVHADLDDLSRRHQRLWFVPYRSSWDPELHVQHWLEHQALLEEWRPCGDRTVSAYRPPNTAPDAMRTVAVAFGDLLLEGAHLTVDGIPVPGGSVAGVPGGLLQVTLDWRALGRIDRGYTVFVHVLDAGGELVAQHDGTPMFGLAPTWTWGESTRVLDRHDVRLNDAPARGPGRILVGIYDTETLQRVPLDGGSDALELGAITFGP